MVRPDLPALREGILVAAIHLIGIVDNLVELGIVTDDAKKTKRMVE